jgi:hypothetical protein
MFVIGNRQGLDLHGKRYPSDVRSLSVGDMVSVRDAVTGTQSSFSVDRFGFTRLIEPINPIVDIGGTNATSRPAMSRDETGGGHVEQS